MARPLRKPRFVLVVDDDPDVATSLQMVLERAISDVRIRVAGSGEEALQILPRNPVELIITDYRMPGMNGIEFLQAAAKIAPNVPRILVTAYPEQQLALMALQQQNVAHFFRKPYEAVEITNVVRAVLGREFTSEMRAEAFRRSMELAQLRRPPRSSQ